jgi:hypothetical protein
MVTFDGYYRAYTASLTRHKIPNNDIRTQLIGQINCALRVFSLTNYLYAGRSPQYGHNTFTYNYLVIYNQNACLEHLNSFSITASLLLGCNGSLANPRELLGSDILPTKTYDGLLNPLKFAQRSTADYLLGTYSIIDITTLFPGMYESSELGGQERTKELNVKILWRSPFSIP